MLWYIHLYTTDSLKSHLYEGHCYSLNTKWCCVPQNDRFLHTPRLLTWNIHQRCSPPHINTVIQSNRWPHTPASNGHIYSQMSPLCTNDPCRNDAQTTITYSLHRNKSYYSHSHSSVVAHERQLNLIENAAHPTKVSIHLTNMHWDWECYCHKPVQ